jgi:WD40 repeat protein
VLAAGNHVISGLSDATVKLWDVASGTCLMTFERHSRGVRRRSVLVFGAPHLGFSFVYFCGGDFAALLWTREAVTSGVGRVSVKDMKAI